MSNIFDSLKNNDPKPTGTNGIGSIDKWVCGNCLQENYEDPMTPRKSRPFICKKCGAKRGEMRIYDIGGMRYDWKNDLYSSWSSKDGRYQLKADKEKLVLMSGGQMICAKAFYGECDGQRVDDEKPDSIRAEDGEGFGEISYFAFRGSGSPSPIVGIIEKDGETAEIEFTSGFAGMSLNGLGLSFGQGLPKPAGTPVYRCDKCGWQPKDPTHPTKFCPECGDRITIDDVVNE